MTMTVQRPTGAVASMLLLFTTIVPPLYLAWRMYWANRMPIMDCDEVYNYWEPLHFLQYGTGQQTWEYAHQYALRPYAYLYPLHGILSWTRRTDLGQWIVTTLTSLILKFDRNDDAIIPAKVQQFYFARALLGLGMGCCELIWLYSLSTTTTTKSGKTKTAPHFTTRQAFWTGVLLWSSAGMNHAAAALLPSAAWMGVWLLCHACFVRQWHYTFCCTAVTATLALGWPFAVLVLVPMGVAILVGQQSSFRSALQLLLWTAAVTIVVQGAVMYIDFQHYGRWTSTTLNILAYNAGAGGDELYGVEPASYYVKNLLLNWNVVAVLGVGVLPLLVFSQRARQNDWIVLWATFAPWYVWLGILLARPHKEERFLYPIYPVLALSAVWTVDTVVNAIGRTLASLSRRKEASPRLRAVLHALVWTVAVVVSLSRTAALSRYYTAPLTVYAQLAEAHSDNDKGQPPPGRYVCTCGEWYRFPSSFFVPHGLELGFLPSSFGGQLPQAFSEHGSGPQSVDVLQLFNDQNQALAERYVAEPQCAWIVELESALDECWTASNTLQVKARAPFLNAQATTSALHRVLYLPYLHERQEGQGVHYDQYVLTRVVSPEPVEEGQTAAQ